MANFRNILKCYVRLIDFRNLIKNKLETNFKFNVKKTSRFSDFTCTRVIPFTFLVKTSYNLNNKAPVLVMSSIFTLLSSKSDEEKEDDLIMTIKRSILCIQRSEFSKAEQMLHVALRMAQQTQNDLGITYIYDVMANLAMEQKQFAKAEKLFVSVMQRLLGSGVQQNDLQCLHISLKLARLSHLQNDMFKAELGYNWTLQELKHLVDKMTKGSDEHLLELWGMAQDWYAHYLMDNGSHKEALIFLENAYNIYLEVHGPKTEQSAVMLNDLGSLHSLIGDYTAAEQYLKKAIDISRKIPNMEEDLGYFHANLGLIYIKKGMFIEAKNSCSDAWRHGNRINSDEVRGLANYCFDTLQSEDKP